MKRLITLLVLALSGCSDAKTAAPPFAVDIIGPAGLRCFAVKDGDQTVGGGCVSDK